MIYKCEISTNRDRAELSPILVHFLISEVVSNTTSYVVIWSAYRSIVQKLVGKNTIWLVKLVQRERRFLRTIALSKKYAK